MQREFDERRNLFLQALSVSNWNDVAIHATELLKMDDSIAYVWANRGVALNRMGFPLDAILNYDRSIALEPTAINFSNKGAAYWDMGNAEEALKWLHKAAEVDPIPQTFLTEGNIYKHQGDLQKAITAYRACVKYGPDYADGHMVLGMALLKTGQLEEGWKEYEWRWKSDQLPARKLKCPQWNGEDLKGKTILVYGEQGLGDILQFARYASILGNQFPRCKIIVEGRPPVKRLLETIPEIYAVINAGEKLPELDYAVPMLTLAGLLTPNINSIVPSNCEYFLKHHDVESWAERLQPLFSRGQSTSFKVGICWAGMSRDTHPSAEAIDRLRSTTLDKFAPLAKIPNILWVSLQKGPPSAQIKTPPTGMTIGDFTEEMYDFYETCCVIENCDLVISVDTAVVHAAASIGKPTWLLSRWDGCWRWFGDRPDSPWYPTLRQFVQPAPNDWDSVMQQVAVELAKMVRNKNEQELNLTMAK